MTWDSILQLVVLFVIVTLVVRNGRTKETHLLDKIADIVGRQDERIQKRLSRQGSDRSDMKIVPESLTESLIEQTDTAVSPPETSPDAALMRSILAWYHTRYR